MASLFDRNGRYYISFYNSDRRPKQKQLALGTSDEREARHLHIDFEEAYEQGRFDPWADNLDRFLNRGSETITCKEGLRRFLKAKKRQDRTANTIIREVPPFFVPGSMSVPVPVRG